MHAGPVKPKHNGAMKAAPWLQAYEKSNVAAGLAHRLVGKGQIGKGMWAEPDNMNGLPRTHIRIPQGLRVSDCVQVRLSTSDCAPHQVPAQAP